MRQLLTILFACIVLPSFAQRISPGESKKKLDAKYGFRDVRFETDTTAIAGLRRAFTMGVTTYYTRPTDNLTVGTATLASLYYVFAEGKLLRVKLNTEGFENTKTVREAFQAEYGDGCTVCRGPGDYLWESGKARLIIDANSISGDASITIESRPMLKVAAEAAKKAGKKAVSDL